jgi:hypothetical protein
MRFAFREGEGKNNINDRATAQLSRDVICKFIIDNLSLASKFISKKFDKKQLGGTE